MGSSFALLLTMVMIAPLDELSLAVETHRQALGQFETLDVETDCFESIKGGKEDRVEYTHWWRRGLRGRFIEKDFTTFEPKTSKVVRLTEPACREYEHGLNEIRLMSGWDADNPFPLPLNPGGKNGQYYGRTRCAIALRDPTR